MHFNGGAVANAANTGGVSGMGLDEAINNAGGPELKTRNYKALPVLVLQVSGSQNSGKRINIGDAKTTIGGAIGGNLAAKWVIHAVGPNFGVAPRTPDRDKLLYTEVYRGAYKATLELRGSSPQRHQHCNPTVVSWLVPW